MEQITGEIVAVLRLMFVTFAMLFTVIGNAMILAAVCFGDKLEESKYKLLGSLAVTDLLVGLITMPVHYIIRGTIAGNWIYGVVACDSHLMFTAILQHASGYHLVAIALDRYWSISDFQYSRANNARKINVMIGVCWALAAIPGLMVQFLVVRKDKDHIHMIEVNKQCWVGAAEPVSITIGITIFYWIPAVVFIALYVCIYRVAYDFLERNSHRRGKARNIVEQSEHSLNSQPSASGSTITDHSSARSKDPVIRETSKENEERRRKQSERKAAVTCSIVACTYLLCYTPEIVLIHVLSWCPSCRTMFSAQLFQFMHSVLILNSAFNPIIYCVYIQKIRSVVYLIITKMARKFVSRFKQ